MPSIMTTIIGATSRNSTSARATIIISTGVESTTMSKTITHPTTSYLPSQQIVSITNLDDIIVGLYSTSAGQSTGGDNGVYSTVSEQPPKAIDGFLSTKYLNFGNNGAPENIRNNSGANTGFFVVPSISNASVAVAIRFATANDFPNRDPITVTLEGTNVTTIEALHLGSSWTLIYSGPTGINSTTAPARSRYVPQQNFSNTIAFRSYRLLITSQRGLADCVQYAEAQILGYV
ncbi:unnamed protein product [Rotaria sp. Silwood2]|nr:unnamed protein product [Rotaria sp. Silwood2]CAF2811998.1 unnamed protein product [Rotaria sp. Silwood2]CAF3386205.1 unnamed protein product [Rotaria sp. Silwood2]CAF4131866.1 unnamed protein product [Rotaria sp. Silwood2]CAF4584849.1 unnamed protein product [Rotaria sp. Silwood2]